MNMMHTDDVNTCRLQLSAFIKDVTGNTLRTLGLLLNQEATREVSRSRIELTRVF
jgi:hypothetical protein